MLPRRRIAPLWDNILTYGSGDDIFVNTSTPGQITFRWNATNEADSSDVQFSVTLFSDGHFRFDYGPGNTNLTPTVGISMGNNKAYKMLSGYDGATSLTNANSVVYNFQPGIADMGAYEFRGSSLDVTPPHVVATTPAEIDLGGSMPPVIGQIQIQFDEEVNPIDANAPANYELRAAVNGIFDDSGDIVYQLYPQYTPGTNSVTLNVLGGPFSAGLYRLMVHGNTSIHDLAGLKLDGDANGSPGGDYIRTFNIIATRTWTGGGGDNLWTTGANWAGGIAPAAGDNLDFPAGAARLESVNDYPAGTSIRFDHRFRQRISSFRRGDIVTTASKCNPECN